ncbi:MAG: hypothetical protein WBL62_09590 [Gallionella sp.]
MKTLRVMLLMVMLLMTWATTSVAADAPVLLNKHLAKLIGKWTSPEGEVIFNADNTLVYKGQKSFFAIAQGTIQISKKKTTQLLPYRFIDGNLIITDAGHATNYIRVDAPAIP